MKKFKKDHKGFTHNLVLSGIAVLVLGVISFAGFNVYKSKNDTSAKAAGWYTVKYVGGPWNQYKTIRDVFWAKSPNYTLLRLCVVAKANTNNVTTIGFHPAKFYGYTAPNLTSTYQTRCSKTYNTSNFAQGQVMYGVNTNGPEASISSAYLQYYRDY